MKKLYLLLMVILLTGCKNEKGSGSALTDGSLPRDDRGELVLTLDERTYTYDDIDWSKSRVRNEEDLRLKLVQEDLPRVEFKFPEMDAALKSGKSVFNVPELERGLKQLQLQFYIENPENADRLNNYIVFRNGRIKVDRSGDNLIFNFSGTGGPMRDKSISFQIYGSMSINL